jgi:hypothetical protein
MFDFMKMEEGAAQMAAAMTAKAPYVLKDAREAVALAMAYEVLKDQEGMRSLIKTLPSLNGGSSQMYLEIARILERMEMIDERNLILGAIAQADKAYIGKFLPLTQGTATTIEDSLKQSEMFIEVATPTAPLATSSQSSTVPATGSVGPRK